MVKIVTEDHLKEIQRKELVERVEKAEEAIRMLTETVEYLAQTLLQLVEDNEVKHE